MDRGLLTEVGSGTEASLRYSLRRFFSHLMNAIKNSESASPSIPMTPKMPSGKVIRQRIMILADKDSGSWMTLSEAHAYTNVCDLYVKDGVVRVIEVKHG